jgi:hypothetical protein
MRKNIVKSKKKQVYVSMGSTDMRSEMVGGTLKLEKKKVGATER